MAGPFDELDHIDRVLLGACTVAWLAALGAGVAATVALVGLGSGGPQGSESADTPWLLYTVIGISVVVIAVAVPLLLRARSQAGSTRRPVPDLAQRRPQQAMPRRQGGGYPGAPVPMSRYRPDGGAAAAVERVWLRYTLAVACAMGVAAALSGIGTYLLATDRDVAAWCCFGLAGVAAAGMIALTVVALRQLGDRTP